MGNYPIIEQYLREQGFIVYPREIICGSIDCPYEQNRFVDVAASKNGRYYAFEYKSSRDYLPRAEKQVANYRKSFDYVTVIAEIPRHDISVNPKRGIRIREILRMGAGLWTIKRLRVEAKELDKINIARLFRQISKNAPIQSHVVEEESDGKLTNNVDMWFWMFYSVLDRRSDAKTFIKAKKILEKERLYHPFSIVSLIRELGKRRVINKIGRTLKANHFRLLKDRTMGDLSQPRSIVEAAQFMATFDFNYENLHNHYLKGRSTVEARGLLWKDLKNKIYGVGERIASQFIRGMVLKGPWSFPLNDDKFLERCRFNIQIASKIGLVTNVEKYFRQLGDFADGYLSGNRGIVAHVLWYLRKKYACPKTCWACPLFDYCFDYGKIKYKFSKAVDPKLQTPHPKNREWIKTKFQHYASNLKILRNQLPISQKYLEDFIAVNRS